MPRARKLTAVPRRSGRRGSGSRRSRRSNAVQRRRRPSRSARPQRPSEPVVAAPQMPKKRAHQHHPLERDVHDAAALGEHAAERAEGERRRVAQRRREQRRSRRRPVRGAPCSTAWRAARSTIPKSPAATAPPAARALPARRRPDARPRRRGCRAGRPDVACAPRPAAARASRRGRRARSRARRSCAAARPAEPLDARGVRGHGAPPRRRIRRDPDPRTSRSAPTNRTTRPWMISVRLPGELRVEDDGSSWRLDVPTVSAPKSSAAKSDADRGVAAEQRDGDAEEADVRRWMSEVAMWNSQPSDVERAGEPGERAGDRHREEVVPLHVDPAVARRLGVEADRAHLEAERRAVEDRPEDDERASAMKKPIVEALEHRSPQKTGRWSVRDDVVRDRVEAAASSAAGPAGRRSTCRPRSRSS